MRPRNCLTSFEVLVVASFEYYQVLSGNGVIPSPDMMCPRYWICLFKKLHLTSLSFKSAAHSLSNRSLKCSKCDSISELKTKISSKYPKVKVRPDKTSFTSLWKYAGVCANPNGQLLNSYLPYEETKAVFGLDSLDKTIW